MFRCYALIEDLSAGLHDSIKQISRNLTQTVGFFQNDLADGQLQGIVQHNLLAERIGKLNKLGTVKVVFSRRRGKAGHIGLVTDDLKSSMKTIVSEYLKRWSIEMLIKDEKQHLGLADYRVLRYQAVVRHLHLVDVAYACLTHLGLKAQRAQGQNHTKKVLRLEPISQLKDRMRRIIWQEAVKDVVKHSHEKPVIRRLEKLLAA